MMARERIRNMTTGSPARLLVGFALPLMAGNMFQQLYTVVDTAVVGRVVGVDALAAVGAADWFNWMTLGVLFGFTQGFSILMAQHFGAGDHRELSRTVGVSLTLTAVIAGLCLGVGEGCAPGVLSLLNTPEDIRPLALLYLRIVFAGIPAIAANNYLASILRALGDSKTPLYAMIGASLLNVGLDLLFVMGFGWGVAGAAVATVIAQVFSAWFCLRSVRKITVIRLEKGDLRPTRERTAALLKLGFPVALQNWIISIGGMIVQSVINRYGMLFIAGFTATNKLYGLLEIAASSYGFALTSYVGQNLGAGRLDRIRKGVRAGVWISLATAVAIGGGLLIFGQPLLSLFISGTQEQARAVLEIAYRYLCFMAIPLPVLYLLYVYRSSLMGLGDTVVPMASGFVEMAMRLSVALFLPLALGQEGIYYAEPAAWTGATVLLIAAYYIRIVALERKRARKKPEEAEEI